MSNHIDEASRDSVELLKHFQSIQQDIAALPFLHLASSLSEPEPGVASAGSVARAGIAVGGVIFGISYLFAPEPSLIFVPLAILLASTNPFGIRPMVRRLSESHMRRTTRRLLQHVNALAATDETPDRSATILDRLNHFKRSLDHRSTLWAVIVRFSRSTGVLYVSMWLAYIPTEFFLSGEYIGEQAPVRVSTILSEIRAGLNIFDPDPGAVGGGFWSLIRLGGPSFGVVLVAFVAVVYAMALFTSGFESSFRTKTVLYNRRRGDTRETAYALERKLERLLEGEQDRRGVFVRSSAEVPWDVIVWIPIGVWQLISVWPLTTSGLSAPAAPQVALESALFGLAMLLVGVLVIMRPLRAWTERVQHPLNAACRMWWWIAVYVAVVGVFVVLFLGDAVTAIIALLVTHFVVQLVHRDYAGIRKLVLRGFTVIGLAVMAGAGLFAIETFSQLDRDGYLVGSPMRLELQCAVCVREPRWFLQYFHRPREPGSVHEFVVRSRVGGSRMRLEVEAEGGREAFIGVASDAEVGEVADEWIPSESSQAVSSEAMNALYTVPWVARDQGPGIRSIEFDMREQYSVVLMHDALHGGGDDVALRVSMALWPLPESLRLLFALLLPMGVTWTVASVVRQRSSTRTGGPRNNEG